jgi:hypothetical protein
MDTISAGRENACVALCFRGPAARSAVEHQALPVGRAQQADVNLSRQWLQAL